jgi:DNA gyrase subunit B
MNPEQLWDTTMNPETRILVKVTMEDAIKADEIVSLLMGDDVNPRREFIEQNAKYVKNLDIYLIFKYLKKSTPHGVLFL